MPFSYTEFMDIQTAINFEDINIPKFTFKSLQDLSWLRLCVTQIADRVEEQFCSFLLISEKKSLCSYSIVQWHTDSYGGNCLSDDYDFVYTLVYVWQGYRPFQFFVHFVNHKTNTDMCLNASFCEVKNRTCLKISFRDFKGSFHHP
jgi:hypothetical protein